MTESPPPTRLAPAYYSAPVTRFVRETATEILGTLASENKFALVEDQRDAWQQEITILKSALADVTGTLYLEFDIPRLGSRIDTVLIAGPAVFAIEFKCGATAFHRADYNQAWDYALDLKNFHKGSRYAPIVPILVATDAAGSETTWSPPHADGVRPPAQCNTDGLRLLVDAALALATGPTIDATAWGSAPYEPTPTIIEAAQALYSRHSVESISRSDAGATNLKVTSLSVERVIARAQKNHEKAIVFVTGVPGAGKTLVGLNVATQHRRVADDPTHAVFLSGNQPLVSVLQTALVRDEHARLKAAGTPERMGAISQRVKPFIQIVHHFRRDGLRDPAPPADRVVVFDEAQRAWNATKLASWMKKRNGVADFTMSEPEFLISYMDRHKDWSVIVCLVGGGQEIHDGEAGIGAWLDALIPIRESLGVREGRPRLRHEDRARVARADLRALPDCDHPRFGPSEAVDSRACARVGAVRHGGVVTGVPAQAARDRCAGGD